MWKCDSAARNWWFEPYTASSERYLEWSLEELRRLAMQLQLPGAGLKSRKELLDLLVGGREKPPSQYLESRARIAAHR
jgi:hypothetical protein